MRAIGIIIIVAVVLAAIIGPQALFIVDETQLALVTRFGAPQLPVKTKPGIYFKTPFVETVTYFEKRLLIFDAPPDDLLTSDKKRLRIDVYARGKISDPLKFFETVITEDRARSRAVDIIASELRREIALDLQSEIIAETREAIMNRVRDRVVPQLEEFGITIVDVRIKRADFPDEIADSIYARMRAERVRIANRERAEGQEVDLEKRATVDRTAIEITSSAQKDADIIRGEGEAEAIKIFAEALEEDPEFYTFQRTLEAYKVFLTQNSTVVLPAESDLFQFLQSPGTISAGPGGGTGEAAETVEMGISAIETAARNHLTNEMSVDGVSAALARLERVEWSDASLGCPEDGVAYAQVITPGYSLVFDHDGSSYDVHTNNDGSQVVSCGPS